MKRTNTEKIQLVNESGLYLAATGQRVKCQNPAMKCDGRAVTYCPQTKVWVCQRCADVLYDAMWGLGI